MDDVGLELTGVTKRFPGQVAVRDVSLRVPRGCVLALLGPSGSGKTTTLRVIAGFERPDAGSVSVGGQDVTQFGPAQRRFGMVFQNYALFPHLDVGDNVAFGLAGAMNRDERAARVAESLRLVDLDGFERRLVTELSGGQQQRVAVARAIAPRPPVLLLDEPLSNLDPALRERTRRELRRALDHIGVTTVFVTHEQDEAFALGDLVAVLNEGAVEQVGPPAELYEHPRTLFAATFVGRASRVNGVMTASDRVVVGSEPQREWPASSSESLSAGTPVVACVRPEALTVTTGDGVPGTVTAIRYTGAHAFFEVETPIGLLEFEDSIHRATVGDTVQLVAKTARVFRRG